MSQSRTADGEARLSGSAIPDQLCSLIEHSFIEAIKENSCSACRELALQVCSHRTGLKSGCVHKSDAQSCLPREMEAQVGLGHWCYRMMTHGWMPVDAHHIATRFRKQISVDDCAAEMRCAHNNGYWPLIKRRAPQFHGAANAAGLRRTVKSRADLVVVHARAEAVHRGKDRRQIFAHPRGSAAAALAGDADGFAMQERAQAARVGRARKQDSFYAVDRKRF